MNHQSDCSDMLKIQHRRSYVEIQYEEDENKKPLRTSTARIKAIGTVNTEIHIEILHVCHVLCHMIRFMQICHYFRSKCTWECPGLVRIMFHSNRRFFRCCLQFTVKKRWNQWKDVIDKRWSPLVKWPAHLLTEAQVCKSQIIYFMKLFFNCTVVICNAIRGRLASNFQ